MGIAANCDRKNLKNHLRIAETVIVDIWVDGRINRRLYWDWDMNDRPSQIHSFFAASKGDKIRFV